MRPFRHHRFCRPFQGMIHAVNGAKDCIMPAHRNRRRPDPADPDQTTAVDRVPKRPYTP